MSISSHTQNTQLLKRMSYIPLPSLQHAAVVRTASLLYNDLEIENMIKNETNIRRQREIIEMKIGEKLSSLFPSSIRKREVKIIYQMHKEVERWKNDHKFLLKHIDGYCSAHICWNSDGTMSRTQTAKKLVANGAIDPKIRFILACTYFLEDEVVALWYKDIGRYGDIERTEKALQHTNLSVRFWMGWLQRKRFRHWSLVIDEYFRNPRPLPEDIPMRVSCFYHLLSNASKRHIDIFDSTRFHFDDFEKCMNTMNEKERIEIFHSHSLRVLERCLEWPFRYVFIDMAEQSFRYLNAIDFSCILHGMMFEYMRHGYEDFHLFEEFWQLSPAVLKDQVKWIGSGCLFFQIESFLKDENVPQDFKEVLRKCLD